MAEGLRLLGSLELVGDQGPIRLGGAKERCVLAVLAVHAGEPVAEDRIVDAVWGDAPPRTAAKTLQNYVLRLRRALLPCDGLAILTRPPGYCLDVGPDATDIAIVEALIAEGRRAAAAGDPAMAAERFSAALNRWRGAALAEFADRPFARATTARLEELRESATEDLVDAELAIGRHHSAIGRLETMVADRPLRERRWGQLVLALYRDDRQAEALAAVARIRAALAEELGVDPGPELRRLETAVLRQDGALLLPVVERPAVRPGAPRTPQHGRDDDLARLLAVVHEADGGRGGVALVAGEPGIGKTRLLAELASVAEREATVLSGRCLEGAGVLPFQPFAEAIDAFLTGRDATGLPAGLVTPALAQLVPRWSARVPATTSGPPLQPDELRMRLLDAVARFHLTLAGHGTVVVLIDDLQWADPGTVAMLRHLARGTRDRPLVVVGAYRSGELTDGHPLRDTLADLHGETNCTTVTLTGLDRHAVGGLLRAVAGRPLGAELVDAIATETGGNPFFAREMIRHLIEEGALTSGDTGVLNACLPLTAVPEGVRQVIGRRRRRLSPAANLLLDAAAAIDGPFPFAPVGEVAGLDDATSLAALDEALAAGLVIPDVALDRYEFAHALIRHAAYADLNPSRRLRLHLRLAEALVGARRDGLPITAAEIAVQYQRSAALPGADAGVAPALEAAELARAAGAHDEDALFLGIARALARPDDPRLPALLARLATALAWSLRYDDAVETALLAAQAPAAGEGPGAAAAFLAGVATALASAGSNRHAWLLASSGIRLAPDRGSDPGTWASLKLLDLDRQEAADPDNPGIPLDAPHRRDALRVLHESGRLAARADLGRYAVAAIYGTRAQVPPRAAEDPTVALFLLGDFAAALPAFEREADAAHARGQLAWEVYCRACVARCHTALGDLDAAAVVMAEADALASRLPGDRIGWQLIHFRGSQDALASALDEGWEPWLAYVELHRLQDLPEHQWATATFDSGGARGYARLGRAEVAMPLLARPVRALRQAPAWAPNHLRIACDAAETLWLLDRRDHLSVVEAALREKALPADFRMPMMDARLSLARLCALDGRTAEASRWFAASRVVLDEQGARPLRAIVDHDEGLMHLRQGDAESATPLLDAAGEAFERLGMTGWTRRLTTLRPAAR